MDEKEPDQYNIPENIKALIPANASQAVIDILNGITKNRVVSWALAVETIFIIIWLPVLMEEKLLFLLSLVPYPLTFRPAYVTGRAYREAKQYISDKWSLRGYMFFATRKHRAKNRYAEHFLWGYCELQWIYLAAKEMGREEEFFELKKEFTHNVLPNF